jgi:hypothetical protein
MSFEVQSKRITSVPSGSNLLVRLIDLSLDSTVEGEFLASALGQVNEMAGSTGTVLVQGVKGQWRVISHAGEGEGLPAELLGETLDAETCQQADGWTAAPLFLPIRSGRLLACDATLDRAQFDSMTAAVGLALESFQRRASQARRAKRLETILEMTVHWNQSR